MEEMEKVVLSKRARMKEIIDLIGDFAVLGEETVEKKKIPKNDLIEILREDEKEISVVDFLKFLNEQEYYFGMILIESKVRVKEIAQKALDKINRIEAKKVAKAQKARKAFLDEIQQVANDFEFNVQVEENLLQKEAENLLLLFKEEMAKIDANAKKELAEVEENKPEEVEEELIVIEEKYDIPEKIEELLPVEEADPFEEKMKEEREKMKREEKEEKEEEVSESESESGLTEKDLEWIYHGENLDEETNERLMTFTKSIYLTMINNNIPFSEIKGANTSNYFSEKTRNKIENYKKLNYNKKVLDIWESLIKPSLLEHFEEKKKKIITKKAKECAMIIKKYNLDTLKILEQRSVVWRKYLEREINKPLANQTVEFYNERRKEIQKLLEIVCFIYDDFNNFGILAKELTKIKP